MKTITSFRCTLETDIVLNQKAATEGNQESLDFIPGNNFLGIAASALYEKLSPEESLAIFHGGKVRFGDAHPEKQGKRSLRVPASMYYPKLKNRETLYIHHALPEETDKEISNLQLKQCRTGFYLFEGKVGSEIKVEKSFAIKSAYDRDKRRSKDQAMYGYESLQAGSSWIFEVAMDDNTFETQIKNALVGRKRVGRSRTAQYGLVNIEILENPSKYYAPSKQEKKDYTLVYAESRLIFLDEYGLPTFQPEAIDDPKSSDTKLKAKHLGFPEGKINWKKSQVRTFQYAPWNFKRQARDTDRCGIEKGSVFYIEYTGAVSKETDFVGVYQNEGFGKVIINPDFLDADVNNKGKALYWLKSEDNKPPKREDIEFDDPLFAYLKQQKLQDDYRTNVYELVYDFVDNSNKNGLFTKDAFASQWGTIRNMAIQYKSMEERHTEINTYITKGVAKDKWEGERLKKFKEFMKKIEGKPETRSNEAERKRLDEESTQAAVINLASEMAKLCSKKEEKKNGK